jgi:mono/diheme cytochrome c family protein
MDGSGTPLGKSMDAPDLRSEAVQKHSDAELAQIIADGKKVMPSFKKTFTEEQIRGLVQYVRELAKNKAPAEK